MPIEWEKCKIGEETQLVQKMTTKKENINNFEIIEIGILHLDKLTPLKTQLEKLSKK